MIEEAKNKREKLLITTDSLYLLPLEKIPKISCIQHSHIIVENF